MEYIYLRLNGSRIEGVQTFERGEGEGEGGGLKTSTSLVVPQSRYKLAG